MKGKRILICCNRTLSMGGIEKALTSFLRTLNTEDNEVLLVLHDTKGPLHQELDLAHVQVFYVSSISPSEIFKEDLKHLRLIQLMKGIYNRIRLRMESDWYGRIIYTYRILQRKLVFPGHFDCAISFSTDYSDLSMICAADADKRVCFVHGDTSKGTRATRRNDHLVRQMDKIYAVSQRAKELFLQVHPKCAKAADVLHNVIIPKDILSKSCAPADGMLLDGTTTLCTVGRLSQEKGQQMIPRVAQMLKEAGYTFRWYLIGDGALRPELEKQIGNLGLEDCVILLGAKPNPYPYVSNCSIYVQTSFSEAYCITVAEARILCRPIVTTDATGLREQINNGINGLIVEEMTPQALSAGILKLLSDSDLAQSFTSALTAQLQENSQPLQKLYDYIKA